MKSLKAIQVLSKIGKIISQILFIITIVAGGICIVAGVLYAIIGSSSFTLGGMRILPMIRNAAKLTDAQIYGAVVAGVISCAVEAVLCGFAKEYFSNELKAGTPFTLAGASEMLRLGILTIALPMGELIVNSVIYAIFDLNGEFDNAVSVGLGIAFIIISVIFRYGASLLPNGETKEG